MSQKVVLESAAQDFSEATAPHPRIYEVKPAEGREILEKVQSLPVNKYNVDIKDFLVSAGKWGDINVRFIRPAGNYTKLPVIYYIHGAGWVFGSTHTHDKLVRELAVRANCVVVFPEYTRSPDVQYPTAIEQNYAVLQKLPSFEESENLDVSRLTVSGDSVGGNMATVMTLMTGQRDGLKINQQLPFYPVTDANFETESYNEFAENYSLTKDGMKWFWDQYTTDPKERQEITASPL